MKIPLVSLVLILMAAPLHAEFSIQDISHGSMWFMVGADEGTTWYAIQKDHRREANSLLTRPTAGLTPGHKLIAQSALVIGMTVAGDYSTHILFKTGHPKLALLGRAVIIGAHGFAVWHNLK